MAPRVRHTARGADQVRELVLGLEPREASGKAKMGITTFIKQILRNGVKFSPRRQKSNATRAGKALARGRAAHRLIETYCKTGKTPPAYRKDPVSRWTRGVARALVQAKIEPLRCELPCDLGQLKTNVDMLGLGLSASGAPELVCCEFKTTSLKHADHSKCYDAPCTRRAVFGGGFGLANTEREAHRVQVAFGIEALKNSYPALADLPMRACVVVASDTATVCYTAKPIPASHYVLAAKMSAITTKSPGDREKLAGGRLFPPLPPAKNGGAAIKALLAESGHVRIRPSRRASCLTSLGALTFAVGIVEHWASFSASHQRSVTAEIKSIAGVKRRPLLVVFDVRKGVWSLKYV